MLEIILGRSGSGKSSKVLERAAQSANDGNNVLVLVPEQFSFATERKMLEVLGGRCLLGVSVLSFSRLCENIFRQYGGLAGKRLDDMSRLMLMKLAVHETGDLLDIYSRQSKRTDFLKTMLETVDELKSSGCYPDRLRSTISQLEESQLKHKLCDIASVYEVYQAIVERSYQDPHDDITRAVTRLRGGSMFAGYHVYIDGFDFFSPPEHELIDCLLEQCEQLTIALTADKLSDSGELDIFHDPKSAAQRLIRRSGELGIPCRKPLVLDENKRTAVPVLLAVESFAATGERLVDCPHDGLTIFAAPDKYEEVRLAAAVITGLVREGGYRYRDVAVVARSLGDYQTALENIFPSFGIPLFFDRKEPVTASPMVAVVTAALDAVRGEWKTEAILRLARCPAMGITMEQAAELENYLYIWSIDGRDWDKPFVGSPSGLAQTSDEDSVILAQLELLRAQLTTPLLKLRQSLLNCTGSSFAMGIYNFLVDTGTVTNLQLYFADDDKSLAETDNLYSTIIDILDLFADTMGNVGLSAATFIEMFELAVGCIELGSIPNTNDQTIAGSADRIRLDSPRATIILGANEGVFPATYQPYGVFSDDERELLQGLGVELSASRFQRALLERFFLYTALSSPSHRLYISYSKATLVGASLEPSLLVSQLSAMFPLALLSVNSLADSDYITDLFTAREQYMRRLGSSGNCAELAQALAAEGDSVFLGLVDKLSADSPAEGISQATASALIKGRLNLAPVGIEDFYSCPYLYFCKRMIKLKPRKRVEYTPLESGSAIHYVFEHLLAELGGKGLAELADNDLRGLISKLLQQFIESVSSDTSSLRNRFKYQFGRLVSVLMLLARHVGEDFAQSLFTPAGVEVEVSRTGDVKPLDFTTSDGTSITVNGKIDRVDLFVDGDDRYARVVDYKSGSKDFRLDEVFYGLNMQMLIYLFALCADPNSRFGKVRPAGILYMPSRVSPVNARPDTAQELLRQLVDETLQMKGLLLEDEHVLRAMERELSGRYIPAKTTKSGSLAASSRVKSAEEFEHIHKVVSNNIAEMGEALASGHVEPLPARSSKVNPCDYCEYGLLCANKNTDLFRDITVPTGDNGEVGDNG